MAPKAKRQRTAAANKGKGKDPELGGGDAEENADDDARQLVQRAPRSALEAFIMKVVSPSTPALHHPRQPRGTQPPVFHLFF